MDDRCGVREVEHGFETVYRLQLEYKSSNLGQCSSAHLPVAVTGTGQAHKEKHTLIIGMNTKLFAEI